MNEDTIVRYLASGRTIILVSGEVKFIRIFPGDHPSEGVKVNRPPIASENLTNNQPSRKLCKIGKSYMDFRLVPKSVTFNDLERRNGRYFALFRHIR